MNQGQVENQSPRTPRPEQRAKLSLEEFFEQFEHRQRPTFGQYAKEAAIKSAVYAPVALAVGTTLLLIGKKILSPIS